MEWKKTIKCSKCGKELEKNVPLSHPKHIFHKPFKALDSSLVCHLAVCRECFNKVEK